ncbi:MAG: hypothetical protein ACR2HD_05170 [Solirubrobacteraceae bacterium]|nr:MAG: hypothetical protein DLM63_09045 [Solirubrobacterales bacterium]
MLFDLRGRGRRRTVQLIYLFLALLMGGGLVLFGVGTGANQGGLLNALTGGGGSSSINTTSLAKSVATAQAQAAAAPQDAAAWDNYAHSAATAGQTGLNPSTGRYSAFAAAQLQQASAAWQHYLSLKPTPLDLELAQEMSAIYQSALNDLPQAVKAQEAIAQASPGDAAQFILLARLAYAAKQTRKGDLAAQKALALSAPFNRPALRTELAAAKKQASGGANGSAATPTTTVPPTTASGKASTHKP